jgi:hypothetical protein
LPVSRVQRGKCHNGTPDEGNRALRQVPCPGICRFQREAPSQRVRGRKSTRGESRQKWRFGAHRFRRREGPPLPHQASEVAQPPRCSVVRPGRGRQPPWRLTAARRRPPQRGAAGRVESCSYGSARRPLLAMASLTGARTDEREVFCLLKRKDRLFFKGEPFSERNHLKP